MYTDEKHQTHERSADGNIIYLLSKFSGAIQS
jgi:hypothetical protein